MGIIDMGTFEPWVRARLTGRRCKDYCCNHFASNNGRGRVSVLSGRCLSPTTQAFVEHNAPLRQSLPADHQSLSRNVPPLRRMADGECGTSTPSSFLYLVRLNDKRRNAVLRWELRHPSWQAWFQRHSSLVTLLLTLVRVFLLRLCSSMR